MTLKIKRDLILLSLIIKGVLMYAVMFSVVYFILAIDGLSTLACVIYSAMVGCVAWILKRIISINDFKRLTFQTRAERREFDKETV